MGDRLTRQRSILPNTDKLKDKTVAVLGLGGVGGTAAEALCRAGVGRLILVDHDMFEETNLNRQIFCFSDSLGKKKTECAKEYLLKIAPDTKIETLPIFFSEDTKELLFSLNPDFIVDAIDTVSSKKFLIKTAAEKGVPLISSMGTGNRLDPTLLKIGKISETKGTSCPLARVMRKELLKEGIENTPVVYSTEQPKKVSLSSENGKHSPGSAVFVPQAAGLSMAYYVVSSLCKG